MLAAVAVGGAFGALLRYGAVMAFPDRSGSLPWTTSAVNVIGCFLLALLPGLAAVRRRPLLDPLLGPGLLGGFTTLSAYADQTRALVADGHDVLAASYVVGTLAACLLAIAGAARLVARLEARREGRGGGGP